MIDVAGFYWWRVDSFIEVESYCCRADRILDGEIMVQKYYREMVEGRNFISFLSQE